jgi:hypothetical protein
MANLQLDAQDYADDLYSLQKSIDNLLDQIGYEEEAEALADVIKQVEGMAMVFGITQNVRQNFLNSLGNYNLEIAPKSEF